ncbi:NnrS family protein [Massilia sp. X63]|uniref:NnrS family protein n=1 Tax=Massilia sp. X63 TaxID=3237285 RepID=UPI0034DD4EBE
MSSSRSGTASPGFTSTGFVAVDAGARPFYLMASGFAIVAGLSWMGVGPGWMRHQRIDAPWLAHEAIFGVLAALFIGFLYRAAQNWTRRDPARGMWLVFIAGVWLAGRGAMLMAPDAVLAAVDCAFLLFAPLPLYSVLKRARMPKHVVLVDLLCLLSLLNVLYHAAALGMSPLGPGKFVEAAAIVSLVLAILCVRHAGADRKAAAAGTPSSADLS